MKSAIRIDIATRLRESGHKVTPQRVSVWETLTLGRHMTADQICVALREDSNFADASTVYRTLDLFTDVGVARTVRLLRPETVYEPVGIEEDQSPHNHFVCLSCGSVANILVTECQDPMACDCSLAVNARQFGSVRQVQSVVTGTCNICVQAASSEKRPLEAPADKDSLLGLFSFPAGR